MLIIDALSDWIKSGMVDAVESQYQGIFDSVNSQVTDVSSQVGQTPQGWNGNVFSMIKTLSESVVVPIAGMILTFVLVYELIQMILEKNNMHDFDTFNIFKWIFKTFVAAYLLTNCFSIVMAVFDLAQSVITQGAGIINNNLDVDASMSDLRSKLEAMGVWELIGLWLESNIIHLCMLNQAQSDRTILAKQLGISQHQLSHVTQSGPGEGLLFFGNVIIPFVDHFPKDTTLYSIMTTRPDEIKDEAA